MKERYLPGIDQSLQVEKVRLFSGLTGGKSKDLPLLDEKAGRINCSLEGYANRLSRSGLISPFNMEYHFKSPRGWIAGSWGNFFLDAPRGLIIQESIGDDGLREGAPVMAGISFSIVGNDRLDPNRYPDLNFFYLKPGDVLVSQIQSQRELTPRKRAKLKKIKWERSLLQAVFEWANETGLPRVLVVPAANNYWLTDRCCRSIRDDLKKRMFLRYDVTARRCGFKQEKENLPYFKETLKKKIYDTFWRKEA